MNSAYANVETLWEALRQVIDPELGCNIVDLGLVYSLDIDGSRAVVGMTLTMPGCPVQESLIEGVQAALRDLCGIEDVEVYLVWEPRWNPAMMTERGRELTGIRV